MNTKKLTILIALVLALALVFTACKSEEQIAASQDSGSTVISPEVHITEEGSVIKNSVSVNGSGKSTIKPDMATVYVTVSSTDKDASKAQDLNSAAMTAVMDALKADGIAEDDITTSNVSLNENYNYEKNPAELTGYTMTNTLSVTIRKIDTVGKVISDAIAAGATSTNGLTFTVSDSSAAYQDALRAAITDAKAKAEAIAAAIGTTIDEVPVSVSEINTSFTPLAVENTAMASGSADSASKEAVVSTGTLDVTAQVTVIYAFTTADATTSTTTGTTAAN